MSKPDEEYEPTLPLRHDDSYVGSGVNLLKRWTLRNTAEAFSAEDYIDYEERTNDAFFKSLGGALRKIERDNKE